MAAVVAVAAEATAAATEAAMEAAIPLLGTTLASVHSLQAPLLLQEAVAAEAHQTEVEAEVVLPAETAVVPLPADGEPGTITSTCQPLSWLR